MIAVVIANDHVQVDLELEQGGFELEVDIQMPKIIVPNATV
jgi:hypothetical protein